jgi:hypothetical protein
VRPVLQCDVVPLSACTRGDSGRLAAGRHVLAALLVSAAEHRPLPDAAAAFASQPRRRPSLENDDSYAACPPRGALVVPATSRNGTTLSSDADLAYPSSKSDLLRHLRRGSRSEKVWAVCGPSKRARSQQRPRTNDSLPMAGQRCLVVVRVRSLRTNVTSSATSGRSGRSTGRR